MSCHPDYVYTAIITEVNSIWATKIVPYEDSYIFLYKMNFSLKKFEFVFHLNSIFYVSNNASAKVTWLVIIIKKASFLWI